MWDSLAIKVHAFDLVGDVISPLTLQSVVPRGMQGLFRKLQSFNGRSFQSLPPSAKEHFLVENTNHKDWSLTLNALSQEDLF